MAKYGLETEITEHIKEMRVDSTPPENEVKRSFNLLFRNNYSGGILQSDTFKDATLYVADAIYLGPNNPIKVYIIEHKDVLQNCANWAPQSYAGSGVYSGCNVRENSGIVFMLYSSMRSNSRDGIIVCQSVSDLSYIDSFGKFSNVREISLDDLPEYTEIVLSQFTY